MSRTFKNSRELSPYSGLCSEVERSTPLRARRSEVLASPLASSLLRVLVYYNLFDHPLTTSEIERFLDLPLTDRRHLDRALTLLREHGSIAEEEGYWFLADRPGESNAIVAKRFAMERKGIALWSVAERVGRLMRYIPWIRGVMISGGLSRYIAQEDGDIDYFIVTTPGRLWIVRTLIVLIRRTLLLNRRTWLCANYFVTLDNLQIRERNSYAACETASVRPLLSRQVYEAFMAENEWIYQHYPNFSPAPELYMPGLPERRSRAQRVVEFLIPGALASRLDRWLMHRTGRRWEKKFPELSEEVRQRSLRTTPTESRSHAGDYTRLVLQRYDEELRKRNIPAGTIGREWN